MRTFLIILFLTFSAFPTIRQGKVYNESRLILPISVTDKTIQAEFEILDKIYCKPSALYLSLRLKYKNISNKSIIFYKYSSLPVSDRMFRIESDGNNKLISEGTYTLFTSVTEFPQYKGKIENIDEDYFVVLAPGESYEINDLKYVVQPLFKKGEYLLEKTFITFPFTMNEYKKLQEHWKKWGIIWAGNVVTSPLKFTIEPINVENIDSCKNLMTNIKE